MLKKLLITAIIIAPYWLMSQELEYQLLFNGIGDNREFFSNIATPQTILGSQGAFEAGLKINNHRMRAGLNKFIEFGSDMDYHKPKLLLYYQYLDDNNEFMMGSFARKGKINFPLAMLTDTLEYYRPNIEGLYTEAKWSWGKQSVFCDWTSRQTDTIRENFTVGFSGEIFFKTLFIEHYYLMYHDAGPAIDIPEDHIKDYMGYAIRLGVRTPENWALSGYLKAGVLGSSYRERHVTEGFVNGTSLFAELFAKYKNYGIKSTLSTGDSHRFAQGDRFYHAKDYLRTDVIWYFINHDNVHASFNLSFHVLNWNDLDQQQQISLIYKFGGSKPIKPI